MSNSLAEEKKLFLIMQFCIVGIVLIGLLLTSGINFSFSFLKKAPVIELFTPPPASCGDGLVSDGETSVSCCQDVGCVENYACTTDSKNVSSCRPVGKLDSAAYKEFVLSGSSLAHQVDNYVANEDLIMLKDLFSKQMVSLRASGYLLEQEEVAYEVILKHADVLYKVQENYRRVQPVASSEDYLRIVLNGGFYTDQAKADLIRIGNLAVEGFSDIERFITYLEKLSPEDAVYLNETFSFDRTVVIEDYRVRQSYFDEIALSLDAIGFINYISILDKKAPTGEGIILS